MLGLLPVFFYIPQQKSDGPTAFVAEMAQNRLRFQLYAIASSRRE